MSADRPIVFLLPSFEIGGTERHMIGLANAFAARGRRVAICTFGTDDGPLRGNVVPAVAVETLGLRRARGFLVPLARYLRRTRPRVLVCAMHTAAVFGTSAHALGLTDAPVVIFEGGFADNDARSRAGRLFRAVRTRVLYRMAARILTNAPGIADELVRMARVPVERIAILPNPLAEEVFEDAGDARCTDIDAIASWPARHPAVCTVARLNANKDVQLLVRAVAALRPERMLSLMVIGDGPERGRLHRLAGELGIADDVHFMGWQAHPWRLLRRGAVFAQASRTEGFSNALIEALAVGCPVVATDAPGATRMLLDDGAAGTLVPVGDVAAMAAAIAGAVDRPPAPERLVARARALTAPSVDATLAEIEGVARNE